MLTFCRTNTKQALRDEGGEMGWEVARVPLGFDVACASEKDWRELKQWLADRELIPALVCDPIQWNEPRNYSFRLSDESLQRWAPSFDTTHLANRLDFGSRDEDWRLDQEIVVALLASPVEVCFPSVAELQSSIRIRRYIAQASAKTALAFDTEAAERPADAWGFDDAFGFTVLPGVDMKEALLKATQPEMTGQLYSFSCYRATEYVILLGIARELSSCNKRLYAKLQKQCEQRVIRSGQFHDVFLREYGSQAKPVPSHYYVPGDRVWFRNPDELSSDITGFEGSWVFYMGNGLFSNFWKRNRPFTIEDKCLEVFHWRNGVVNEPSGVMRMDETEVERRVELSNATQGERASILNQMIKWRAPKGVYGQGGCIDTTRESPRWVCEGTADLEMPNNA
jgi:Protein-glutamine gamma-glutamyltransferase